MILTVWHTMRSSPHKDAVLQEEGRCEGKTEVCAVVRGKERSRSLHKRARGRYAELQVRVGSQVRQLTFDCRSWKSLGFEKHWKRTVKEWSVEMLIIPPTLLKRAALRH